MPRLHVCSLARVPATVEATGARSLLTLINIGTPVARPAAIAQDRHHFIGVSDIVAAEYGQILPIRAHVASVLEFLRGWDRNEPMVIHCYAGVSRSTAAAFIGACALHPDRDEAEIARAIRHASPTATPNARLVAIADDLLNRDGRMTQAIAAIGRGEDCFEGVPFFLDMNARQRA